MYLLTCGGSTPRALSPVAVTLPVPTSTPAPVPAAPLNTSPRNFPSPLMAAAGGAALPLPAAAAAAVVIAGIAGAAGATIKGAAVAANDGDDDDDDAVLASFVELGLAATGAARFSFPTRARAPAPTIAAFAAGDLGADGLGATANVVPRAVIVEAPAPAPAVLAEEEGEEEEEEEPDSRRGGAAGALLKPTMPTPPELRESTVLSFAAHSEASRP